MKRHKNQPNSIFSDDRGSGAIGSVALFAVVIGAICLLIFRYQMVPELRGIHLRTPLLAGIALGLAVVLWASRPLGSK
jgi:hypothetical protein